MAKIESAGIVQSQVLYCHNTSEGYFDSEFSKQIKWDTALLSGYKYCFLKNSFLSKLGGFFKYSNLDISKHLVKSKTDVVVIHGWNYFTAILALVIGRLNGLEIWLRAESPLNQEILKPWFNRLIKKVILQKLLFKMVNRFLYIGSENKKFYEYFGVKESKLIFWPYAVDNDSLLKSANGWTKLRAKQFLGLSNDGFTVLFSGKLIKKKRPMDLVEAFYNLHLPNSTLMIIGSGELRARVDQYIEDNKITSILMTGFVNQTELPVYFAAADLFVLPSGIGETWGLVVNEAMNYSLALVVSDLVGSSPDLVKQGINGYRYKMGDIEALSDYIRLVWEDNNWANQAGKESLKIIYPYSYNTILNSLKLLTCTT